MCGHFNAVLPSETCRTKTWAEGLATMYNQKPTSLPSQNGWFSTAKVGRQGSPGAPIMTSEGAVRRTFISAAKPHNKAACSLSVK